MQRVVSLALTLLLWSAVSAHSHSLGMAKITFSIIADAIEISANVASSIEPGTPRVPTGCKLTREKVEIARDGGYKYSGLMRCQGEFDKSAAIQFDWPVSGALVSVRSPDRDGNFIIAGGADGLRIGFSQLSGTKTGKLEAAKHYTALGIEHIWFGIDHLLFVTLLLFLVAGHWSLVKTITAFTLGHSITLALATLGFVSVSSWMVESLIALSIVMLAADVIRLNQGNDGITSKYPWFVAAGFGLLHGLGFAGALGELGIPTPEIPFALLFFNIGVELGQIAYVLVALAAIAGIFSRKPADQLRGYLPRLPVPMLIASSYAIGALATFWFVDRVGLVGGAV